MSKLANEISTYTHIHLRKEDIKDINFTTGIGYVCLKLGRNINILFNGKEDIDALLKLCVSYLEENND